MPRKTQNPDVKVYQKVQETIGKLKRNKAKTIIKIKKDLKETVVVFVDMVDSTRFKTQYYNNPEKWISKVEQFSTIVASHIEDCHGTPVKYIGDEVMAVFKRQNKITDALSFILRISNIESDISAMTKSPTQIKISIDYGKVYFLSYGGHIEADPQGTPIDRCARISKYCAPSTIVTSSAFKTKCDNNQVWASLGKFKLKGIGETEIFQHGQKTISFKVETSESELEKLKSAGRICDLLNHVGINVIAPKASKIWVWDKKCLVIDYIIGGKYGVTVDVYLDELPFKIFVFARDNINYSGKNSESEKYFSEVICNDKAFLPNPLSTYKRPDQKRLTYAEFKNFDLKAIKESIKDILGRIERYISINFPEPKISCHILNKASGKAVDVALASTQDGAVIQLYTQHQGGNQIWEICRQKDNLYSIVNKHSKKCLEVKGKPEENAAPIQQNTFTGGAAQLWKIESNIDGTHYIMPHHSSSMYLEQDAETVNNEPGRLIQHPAFQHGKYGRDHQKWILKPLLS